MKHLKEEKTFVLIKPDGVQKGLIGEIIKRFEQRDLKIVALELFQPTVSEIDNHYPKDPVWINRLFSFSIFRLREFGKFFKAKWNILTMYPNSI